MNLNRKCASNLNPRNLNPKAFAEAGKRLMTAADANFAGVNRDSQGHP
jgi:hypothetical protein